MLDSLLMEKDNVINAIYAVYNLRFDNHRRNIKALNALWY